MKRTIHGIAALSIACISTIVLAAESNRSFFYSAQKIEQLAGSYQRVKEKRANEQDTDEALVYLGYIMASIDMYGDNKLVCIYDASPKEVASKVANWLNEHNRTIGIRNERGSIIVLRALSNTFPCNGKK